MNDRPLRVGVVGLGFGAAIHIPAFQSLPNVTVAACLGARPDHTREVAQRLGIEKPCQTLDEFLDQPLDAVSLALPPFVVAPVLEQVLINQLPVLCEKPIATDVSTALRLARIAADRAIPTAVDFQFRHVAAFHRLRRMLREGVIGAVHHTVVEWHVHSYAHRQRKWSWKTDRSQGGGVMTLLGSHLFDLVEWLLSPITALDARYHTHATRLFAPSGSLPAEDSVGLMLELQNDSLVTCSLSNAAPGPTTHRWTIHGSRASIVLENPSTDYMANFSLTIFEPGRTPRPISLPSDEVTTDGRLPSFRALASNFIISTRTRSQRSITDDFPTLTQGARIQQLLANAAQSAEFLTRTTLS